MPGIAALLVMALMGPQAVPPSEKASRTAAEKKISSQLLYEIYRAKGQAKQKGVPTESTIVKVDAKQRALVDVRAPVTQTLTRELARLGGTIVSTSPEANSVIAWVPLLSLERLAEGPSVQAIQPALEPIYNKR